MCQLAEDISFNFADHEALEKFREHQSGFLFALMQKLISSFAGSPWTIKNFNYLDMGQEYRAVTPRRRSSIIDGFEEIELHVRPIIPREEWESLKTSNTEFSQELARWSMGDGRGKIAFSAYVKIYTSRYNTVDQSYWLKSTEEQEYRYREALLNTFRKAIRETCEGMQLRWEQIDGDSSRCGSIMKFREIPTPESRQGRE